MKYNNWNIVVNDFFIQKYVSKSKYFKKDLGKSLTVEKKNKRDLRQNEFTSWYYNVNKSLIYKKGSLGIIDFYCDYSYSTQIKMGIFLNDNPTKNFIFGIPDGIKNFDNWIGDILVNIEQEIANENKKGDFVKLEDKKGNADALKNNPGAVTWRDVVEYKKRQLQNNS